MSDDRLVAAVGDVCGKGITAALFMAVTLTLLRTLARQLEGPAEILTRLNDELAAQNPRGMFVTMVCLDVRGGHGPVRERRPRHDAAGGAGGGAASGVPLLRNGARPLPGPGVHERDAGARGGDSLVLYTDGVTEATDAADALFGEERLQACFAGGPGPTAADTVDLLLRAVRAHAGGAPQSDDITILALRRTDPPPAQGT